ncbi:helix-turn-helix domain-containing protein [Streptomyces sp. QTS52]
MPESSNETHVSEPAWVQELEPLPIPYAPHTKLKGDAATLFTKCATRAYDRGGSIRDIAGRTNRSFGAVRHSLLEAGVTLRGQGGAHPRIRQAVA